MFFRRSTHPSENDLSAYVDGELDVAQARWLVVHLDTCGECRAAIGELRETKALMADLPRAPLTRSFTLTAAQAGVQDARPAPARPSALRFAPALSLAVLAILLVVDIATPGSSSQSTSSANHGGLVAKSASESADSAAGKTLQAPNTTLQAPRAASNSDAGVPGSTAPSAGAAVIPPSAAPSLGAQAAPSVPSTQSQAGAAASPPQPQILSQPVAPSAGGAVPPALAPPVAIQPFGATVTAGGAGAAAGVATPQAAAAPPITGFNPITPVAPLPGALNPVAPVPSPGQDTSVTVATKTHGGGVKLLRVLEVLAALVFIASLLAVFWPRLIGKER